jgi:hypothetical protein
MYKRQENEDRFLFLKQAYNFLKNPILAKPVIPPENATYLYL